MADDQQQGKTSSPATSLPPVSAAAQPQPSTASVPAKGPLISRRVFLVGALGASALLTVASVAGSGGILGPLFPPKNPQQSLRRRLILSRSIRRRFLATMFTQRWAIRVIPRNISRSFSTGPILSRIAHTTRTL